MILYTMIRLIDISRSLRKGKKWAFSFLVDGHKRTVHFGSSEYEDYTIHKDPNRMRLYQLRHIHDNLNDPFSPGALSWYVLWTSPDFQTGVKNYLNRFHIVPNFSIA